MSDSVLNIPKTDLARKTRQVLRSVQQGQTVMIESYGQPEAAIIDITDYQILRAALAYYAYPIEADGKGLAVDDVAAVGSLQERFNLVIGNYLAESISLNRAAELLDLPGLNLRARLLRLGVPLRSAPANEADAMNDGQTALEWAAPNN